MYGTFRDHLSAQLAEIDQAGLTKRERSIHGPQATRIAADGADALNFCANNYLGLADHPALRDAAKAALDDWGYGMASVRFICGTQEQHLELERRVSRFLGTEATILYSSCFDANGGVFETLFGPEDAIVSDELNHASIIDGIRLSKAMRYRYRNRDLDDLRAQLTAAREAGARFTVIATDGVFSMDGYIAPLREICDLADEFGALVLVDETRTRSGSSASTAGAPLSCAGSGSGWTSTPARSAKRSAARPADTCLPAARSWSCCGSARGPICSPTRSRRRSSPGPSPRWICWSSRTRCVRASPGTPPCSAS